MSKSSPVRYAGCEIALATFNRWAEDPRELSRVIGAFERLHAQLSDQSRRIRGERPKEAEPEYLRDTELLP